MKIFAVALFVSLLALAKAVPSDTDTKECYGSVTKFCEKIPQNEKDVLSHCTARAKNFQKEGHPLSEYASLQLEISYKYLLLATQFNAYAKDRPGFYAKFKALSDRSWAAGQNLIKYITKRGGHVKFINQGVLNNETLAEFNEFQAMATVLDTEKSLFEKASEIHNTSLNNKVHQDPEVAHYIEEEFLGNLATTIRQYSGYTNDLKNLYVTSQDISMDNYLFDQYLQKA